MQVGTYFPSLASKEYITGISDSGEVTSKNLNILQRILRRIFGCYRETRFPVALKEIASRITQKNTVLSDAVIKKVSDLFNKIQEDGSTSYNLFKYNTGSVELRCDYGSVESGFQLGVTQGSAATTLYLLKKDEETLLVNDCTTTRENYLDYHNTELLIFFCQAWNNSPKIKKIHWESAPEWFIRAPFVKAVDKNVKAIDKPKNTEWTFDKSCFMEHKEFSNVSLNFILQLQKPA